MITLIVVGCGFVCFGLLWLYCSLMNFVDANEMAIRVIWGKEDPEVYKAGARLFIPWLPSLFHCYLERYPLGMFDLDYDTIKVMSKEGDYAGKHRASVEVAVDSRAYLNFPREREMLVDIDTDEPIGFICDLSQQERIDLTVNGQVDWRGHTVVLELTHPLIKIFRAGVPIPKIVKGQTKEERAKEMAKLQDWSGEAMSGSVRSAAAQMTWVEGNENARTAFKDRVEEGFLDADGALIQAGFRPSGIKIAIQAVDPPKPLKDALAAEEAAPHVAARERIEVGNTITTMVDEQIEALKKHHPMTKKDCQRVRQEVLNQLTRDRTMKGGGKLTDNRIANADGTSFASGSVSELVGGIVLAVSAALSSKDSGGGSKDSGRRRAKDMTREEKDRAMGHI